MEIKNGDLLSVKEGIIVHGCNAQGVMGSGVAKAIRDRYPEAYNRYRAVFVEQGERLNLGQIIPVWVTPTLCIVNGITQDFYGRTGDRYVDYAAVGEVFRRVVTEQRQLYHVRGENYTINFPKIGAGLGGGDWNVIEPIITEALGDVPGVLWVYGE